MWQSSNIWERQKQIKIPFTKTSREDLIWGIRATVLQFSSEYYIYVCYVGTRTVTKIYFLWVTDMVSDIMEEYISRTYENKEFRVIFRHK
jgi:hypothetical protein